MKLIQQIKDYKPYDEQEEKDKELILSFLEKNDDAFYRTDRIAHMTASCWIVNEKMDKALLCFHKIYNSWSWLGGHADGDENLLHVALKEAHEESGLNDIRPYDGNILSLETLCVNGHVRKGEYVSSHLHMNVTYLLVASEEEKTVINENENTDLGWFDLDAILKMSDEPWFVRNVYPKLIEKVRRIKTEKNMKSSEGGY